jgi:hypothetical protein
MEDLIYTIVKIFQLFKNSTPKDLLVAKQQAS